MLLFELCTLQMPYEDVPDRFDMMDLVRKALWRSLTQRISNHCPRLPLQCTRGTPPALPDGIEEEYPIVTKLHWQVGLSRHY